MLQYAFKVVVDAAVASSNTWKPQNKYIFAVLVWQPFLAFKKQQQQKQNLNIYIKINNEVLVLAPV